MSRKAYTIAVLMSFAVLAAAVVVAQAPAPSFRTVRVQNLYAYVVGLNTEREDSYNIAPSEPVPVRVGEEVEVSLYGETGGEEDEQVDAVFRVAAGRDRLQIIETGDNWVSVRIKGGGGGVAQLGYEVQGDYSMRPGLLEGRITFEIQ